MELDKHDKLKEQINLMEINVFFNTMKDCTLLAVRIKIRRSFQSLGPNSQRSLHISPASLIRLDSIYKGYQSFFKLNNSICIKTKYQKLCDLMIRHMWERNNQATVT